MIQAAPFTAQSLENSEFKLQVLPGDDENELRNQLHASGIGLFSIDLRRMRFRFCELYKDFTSFSINDDISLARVIRLIGSEHIPSLKKAFKEAYLGAKSFEFEFKATGQKSETKWLRASGKFTQEIQKPIFRGFISEITDLKKAEAERNELVAMLNHELRTPLTTIKLYVQLVSEMAISSGDRKYAEMLTVASMQADVMTQLIEDFLALSALEGSGLQIKRSRFEINELFSEIVTINYAKNHGNRFVIESMGPTYLTADKLKITQVLHNFISNAIKYSSQESEIVLFCKRIRGKLTIGVRDKGFGISKEDQKNLFTKFFRSEDENVQRKSGNGIGLYLVKKILQQHKGNVGIKSRIGQGSTFYFSLPG